MWFALFLESSWHCWFVFWEGQFMYVMGAWLSLVFSMNLWNASLLLNRTVPHELIGALQNSNIAGSLGKVTKVYWLSVGVVGKRRKQWASKVMSVMIG